MKNIFEFSGDFNTEQSIENTFKIINDSFYVCNLSDVIRKFDDWKRFLPRVEPFYAVKCNDNINVIKALASVGCSFDCASMSEIEKVLSLNIDAERIIFANPTKPANHIEYAKQYNIRFITFDNEDEIYKIRKIHPDAK